MKRCKIPSGCKLPHRPCCADCEDKTCEKRCWNSPERCRCWEETPPPRQGRGRTYDWEEIARLHREGLSNVEIAGRVGAAPQTVSSILKKLGVSSHG